MAGRIWAWPGSRRSGRRSPAGTPRTSRPRLDQRRRLVPGRQLVPAGVGGEGLDAPASTRSLAAPGLPGTRPGHREGPATARRASRDQREARSAAGHPPDCHRDRAATHPPGPKTNGSARSASTRRRRTCSEITLLSPCRPQRCALRLSQKVCSQPSMIACTQGSRSLPACCCGPRASPPDVALRGRPVPLTALGIGSWLAR